MKSSALLIALLACGGGSSTDVPGQSVDVEAARKNVDALTPEGTRAALDALPAASTDPAVLGLRERAAGLGELLYAIAADPIDAKPITKGGPGWRDHVVGAAASALARAKGIDQLAQLARLLDPEIADDPRDPWLLWLRARVSILNADRRRATTSLDAIDKLGKPFLLATLDRATLLAQRGETTGALDVLLDKKSDEVFSHPLTTITRAMIAGDAGAGLAREHPGSAYLVEGMGRLDSLPAEPGAVAYKEVGGVQMALATDRYDLAAAGLKKLGSMRAIPNDCGIWKRIAWAHVELGRGGEGGRGGDFRTASVVRTRCTFGGADPEMATVDAALQLAIGRPDNARTTAVIGQSEWARVVEAEAALELGDAAGALASATRGAKGDKSPASFATRVVEQQARAVLGKGKDREAALAELARLADAAKTQRARHALGAAYFAIGDLAAAKRELRRAVTETSATSPNPHAVHTRVLLGEIAFVEGDLPLATEEAQQALAIHEANHGAKVLQAKIALRSNAADKALSILAAVRKLGSLTPAGELVVAEALVTRKDATADQRSQAKQLVTGLVGKPTIDPAELGRVAALVDPKLPAELELPVGKLPRQKT